MMPARTDEEFMTGNPGKTTRFRGGHKEDDVFKVARRAHFFKRDSGKKRKKRLNPPRFQQRISPGHSRSSSVGTFWEALRKKQSFSVDKSFFHDYIIRIKFQEERMRVPLPFFVPPHPIDARFPWRIAPAGSEGQQNGPARIENTENDDERDRF